MALTSACPGRSSGRTITTTRLVHCSGDSRAWCLSASHSVPATQYQPLSTNRTVPPAAQYQTAQYYQPLSTNRPHSTNRTVLPCRSVPTDRTVPTAQYCQPLSTNRPHSTNRTVLPAAQAVTGTHAVRALVAQQPLQRLLLQQQLQVGGSSRGGGSSTSWRSGSSR
jgi:hypothetical protein